MSTYDCSALQWGRLLTSANSISWTNLDAFVTGCKAAGITQGLYAIHGTPTFLAQGYPGTGQAIVNDPYGLPGGGSYPTDLTQLVYFCTQFALRNINTYGGFFKLVQILNEPEANNFTGTTVGQWWGTAVQFVNFRATAYRALKSVDSSLTILTCGMYKITPTFNTWLATSADAGTGVGDMGWQTFDAVASHPYWATANGTYSGRGTHESLPEGGIYQIRKALIPYNKQNVDIYCTEFGYDSGGSRASPTATIVAWLAQTEDERRIQTIRRFMAGIRTGLKLMCDFSYGGNLLSGDQVTDTTGYILGRKQVYSALAGKTLIAAGYYPDGREWITTSDGATYIS